MVRAEIRRRLTWLPAKVTETVEENPHTRSIVFECPGWPGHLPGQHLDMRLTAEDGYQAQRSYSIASPEDGERVTVTVESVPEGEVSPFLVEELRIGDVIEIRGPIGGYFVWEPGRGGPLLAAGGGSGIVPLMSMVRSRLAAGSEIPVRLVVSARSQDRLIYAGELAGWSKEENGIDVVLTLTRSQPPGWEGQSRRIDREMLAADGFSAGDSPHCFVCGPTGFVETVAGLLVDLGHDPQRIKTERFGPTGG